MRIPRSPKTPKIIEKIITAFWALLVGEEDGRECEREEERGNIPGGVMLRSVQILGA